MSFLNITDPKKRDFIVNEFLKTKRNIQENFLSERLGDISTQRELRKLFKPITESQKKTKESLLGELKPIKENLRELPAAITYPQVPAIAAPPEEDDEDVMRVGKIAHQYLGEYVAKQNVDKTFGIYKIPLDNQYYIGDTAIDIDEDNVIIGDKEYTGTPGLWELLVSKQPDKSIYTPEDYNNYGVIMMGTNAIRYNNNPASRTPKASKSFKWKTILQPIWKNKDKYEGQGTSPAVVIPSDPDALVERLKLLLASKEAGNTGVRNELIAVCDELLRQNQMTKSLYKKLMSHFK